MPHIFRIFLVASTIARIRAHVDIGYGEDEDLTRYVTRPDIKAPLFQVHKHEPSKITPGYWFVAPYAYIEQESHARNYYQPCQTGPHIYDGNGNLIWSGACMFKNQNMCDFRPWYINNTWFMSGILTTYVHGGDRTGHGVILNNFFETIHDLRAPEDTPTFDMHELQLHDNGKSATHLMGMLMPRHSSASGPAFDVGIREMDIATNKSTFLWWGLLRDHISLTESQKPLKQNPNERQIFWDWFHANSIDKNDEGDYLLSSRYTDTIYKISHLNGSILWRLGGMKTSFRQDFRFSRQHDARWISVTPDRELISFLNNDADLDDQRTNFSSAVLVELDKSTTPMTAQIVRHLVRPDKKLTRRRGNHQILPNGNSFVCWSDNAYISEHASDGQVVLEAEFKSDRFTTYRAYKSSFIGSPNEPPAVKAFVYGISSESSTTVVYVSWNGATEVTLWKLYSQGGGEEVCHIGQINKTSFEDVVQGHGCHEEIFVEAYDIKGQLIGRSPRIRSQFPEGWKSKSCARPDWANSVRDGDCSKSRYVRRLACYFKHHQAWYLLVILSVVFILASLARRRTYRRLRSWVDSAKRKT